MTLDVFHSSRGTHDDVRRSCYGRLAGEDGGDAVALTTLTQLVVQTGWVFGQGFLVSVDQILTQQQVTNELQLTCTPSVEAFLDGDVLAADT
ncbi:hypothetical protein D3C76_1429950 [compost metagenome]